MTISDLSHQDLLSLIPTSPQDETRMACCEAVHAEVLRRQRAVVARLRMTGALEDFGPYLEARRN